VFGRIRFANLYFCVVFRFDILFVCLLCFALIFCLFVCLRSVFHLGLSYNEIETIQCDYQGNIQNTMFLCLQLWRQKTLDATLADMQNALEKEENDTHRFDFLFVCLSSFCVFFAQCI
jgi:hypothetical protein